MMRKRSSLPALLVFVLFALACGGMTTKWETVSEPGFTVEMPGKPQKQVQPAGPLTMNSYLVDKGDEGYMMAYSDIPKNVADMVTNPEQFLNNGKEGMIRTFNGKLSGERQASIGNHPGKEFSGEGNTKGKDIAFTARVYWVKPRLYQVVYMREKSKAASPDGQKFLDSFKLQ